MSRRGTIKRYTLIIEKTNGSQYPNMRALLEFLIDQGFEVSQRTLERDIEAIRNEFGVEITYNRSRKGYFVDKEESIDIESFLRFLEIVNTAELLTESLADSKETLNYISFDKGGGLKGVEYLRPLLKSIREHREISFQHFSYQTRKLRNYSMQPYLLKEYQNRWYIVGMVKGLWQFRTFGVDRIEDLELKDELFVPDKKLNPIEKFKDVIGVVYADGKKENVILTFTPDQGYYVKSLPLHASQKILVDNDKEFRVELFLVPNYELIQTILNHNQYVTVLKPEWLAQEIQQRLKLALDNYS